MLVLNGQSGYKDLVLVNSDVLRIPQPMRCGVCDLLCDIYLANISSREKSILIKGTLHIPQRPQFHNVCQC